MIRKKVAVIGSRGYVGKAYAEMFRKRFDVIEVDPLLGPLDPQFEDAYHADLVVVCVPTPMMENGAADTTMVEETVKRFTAIKKAPLILIKSTIPPGTTARLRKETKKRIVFSPEYIGEGAYTIPWWKNFAHPTDPSIHPFSIFGGAKDDTRAVAEFFKPILGPDARYGYTDSTTAELTKYMENCFFATKVSFCNQMYDIAGAFSVDYDELRELWLLDERMGRMHTLIFQGKRGFDGKCLPKDLSALVTAAKKAGADVTLLKAVQDYNNKIRANQ